MIPLNTPLGRGIKRRRGDSNVATSFATVDNGNPSDGDAANLRAPKVLRVGTDFGGMDMPVLACKKLGLRYMHVFSSDISPPCRTLMKHVTQPEVLYEDVRKRDVAQMHATHVYIWGAPCQPFSSCGKGQGRSDTKGRGNLALASLHYIKHHKPRLTIMENVRGLIERHPKTFAAIFDALTRYGYQVHHKVLNTRDHGVPHQRDRIWLVAIRNDSVKRQFTWPSPVPLQYTAADCLLPFNPETDNCKALPPKTGKDNRSRELVKLAYMKCLQLGLDPRKHIVFTDVDCSIKFSTYSAGYLPCMTATRASTRGWWVSTRGRRIYLPELFRFQGLHEADVPWQQAGVTPKQMAHMLGNTMSLNVCERVLGRALWCAGLVSRAPPDRWALRQRPHA
jgi:DNA-cytosine methyltransferase